MSAKSLLNGVEVHCTCASRLEECDDTPFVAEIVMLPSPVTVKGIVADRADLVNKSPVYSA